MSGYTKDQLLTMKISDVEAIESSKDIKNRINYIIKNGSDRFETKHRKKDGSVYDVAINIQYKIFDEGQFIVFIDDITERKQAQKSITALEKRNQALLDHSPACHKIVDLDFNLQYMSANGFKILKLDQNSKVYGKPYPFEFFPDLFRNKMIETIQKVKETGKTLTLEAMANDVQGNEVWLKTCII